jgi:hypothetical protein
VISRFIANYPKVSAASRARLACDIVPADSGLMMSRLHIASWGLLVGAAGQCALYSALVPHFPSWVFWVVLLPPWLTVYAISFCKQPPFGPRRFRHCLIFAMCWYAVATLLVEILHLLFQPAPLGHFPNILARSLMYAGALSFIVFVRTCTVLRSYEAAKIAAPEFGIHNC